MKKLFLVIFMMFSFNAFAGISSDDVSSAGFSSLSETQKAEIIAQVEKLKNTNANIPAENAISMAERWTEVGTNIGKGMAGAAKELGVAVNEFAETPVGKMTAYLIIYKLVGKDLLDAVLGIVGAFVVWICGGLFIWALFKRSVESVTHYAEDGKTVKAVAHREMDGEKAFMLFWGCIIILAGGLIVLLT